MPKSSKTASAAAGQRNISSYFSTLLPKATALVRVFTRTSKPSSFGNSTTSSPPQQVQSTGTALLPHAEALKERPPKTTKFRNRGVGDFPSFYVVSFGSLDKRLHRTGGSGRVPIPEAHLQLAGSPFAYNRTQHPKVDLVPVGYEIQRKFKGIPVRCSTAMNTAGDLTFQIRKEAGGRLINRPTVKDAVEAFHAEVILAAPASTMTAPASKRSRRSSRAKSVSTGALPPTPTFAIKPSVALRFFGIHCDAVQRKLHLALVEANFSHRAKARSSSSNVTATLKQATRAARVRFRKGVVDVTEDKNMAISENWVRRGTFTFSSLHAVLVQPLTVCFGRVVILRVFVCA